MYTADDVNAAITALDPTMNNITAAAGEMNTADMNAWSGIYHSWQTTLAQWAEAEGSSAPTWLAILYPPALISPALADADATMAQVNTAQNNAKVYGPKVGITVPSAVPTPPPTPDKPSSWPWYYWAGGGVAVAAGLFVLDKFTDILGDYSFLKGK